MDSTETLRNIDAALADNRGYTDSIKSVDELVARLDETSARERREERRWLHTVLASDPSQDRLPNTSHMPELSDEVRFGMPDEGAIDLDPFHFFFRSVALSGAIATVTIVGATLLRKASKR